MMLHHPKIRKKTRIFENARVLVLPSGMTCRLDNGIGFPPESR